MCVTICGRFRSDEGVVAGYDNRIRAKYTAKWGVQIAGMIFQTGSKGTPERALSEIPTPQGCALAKTNICDIDVR